MPRAKTPRPGIRGPGQPARPRRSGIRGEPVSGRQAPQVRAQESTLLQACPKDVLGLAISGKEHPGTHVFLLIDQLRGEITRPFKIVDEIRSTLRLRSLEDAVLTTFTVAYLASSHDWPWNDAKDAPHPPAEQWGPLHARLPGQEAPPVRTTGSTLLQQCPKDVVGLAISTEEHHAPRVFLLVDEERHYDQPRDEVPLKLRSLVYIVAAVLEARLQLQVDPPAFTVAYLPRLPAPAVWGYWPWDFGPFHARLPGAGAALVFSPHNVLTTEQVEVKPSTSPEPVSGAEAAPTLPPVPVIGLDELADTVALLGDAATPAKVGRALQTIGRQFTAARQPLIDAVNRSLAPLEGRSFGSFEANQAVVNTLSEFARVLGLRFECQKPACGAPSALVLLPGNARDGAFAFRHSGTNHGGRATLPPLRLIPAKEEPTP